MRSTPTFATGQLGHFAHDRVRPHSSADEVIGDKVAESLVDYFKNPEKTALLEKLQQAGLTPEGEVVIQQDGPLTGKTFVITGTLSKWSRKEAEELVEKAGGRAAGSVSKKTDYLLAGENAGSKRDKAEKLGIEILDEKTFAQQAVNAAVSSFHDIGSWANRQVIGLRRRVRKSVRFMLSVLH